MYSVRSREIRAMTEERHHDLTFHHISLVVTVIVAVCWPIVDVESLDGCVVITGGSVL